MESLLFVPMRISSCWAYNDETWSSDTACPFSVRLRHTNTYGEWQEWVDYRLLEKSNIRKACKTCSDHKPAVHDSERPVTLAQLRTVITGQQSPFPDDWRTVKMPQNRSFMHFILLTGSNWLEQP